MTVDPEEQKFENDNELTRDFLNWLRSRDASLNAPGISNLPQKMCYCKVVPVLN
jgi:hypothetical protein